jgi:hypothetical protein
MSTRYRLQYTRTNDHSGDTEIDVDVSFENADYSALCDNLNTWLKSIGMQLEVQHKYDAQVSELVSKNQLRSNNAQ